MMFVVVCVIAVIVTLLIVGVIFIAASSGFDQNVRH